MNYEENNGESSRTRNYNGREQNKEIFSRKFVTERGKRTYYFDVKESQDGAKYLVISESRKFNGVNKRDRILIFEEDVSGFWSNLKKTISFMLDLEEDLTEESFKEERNRETSREKVSKSGEERR